MNKTFALKKENIKQDWTFIDANDKILGVVAAEAVKKLMGKHKATFTNTMNMGDKVVIVNAEKVAITGNKLLDKKYNWHTGFPKGLREESMGHLMNRKPTEVLKRAISGMLPKNKLRKVRMANLYIYAGPEHKHSAQQNAPKKVLSA
ncbi:MAG TPA: 50S ribosomal protein L13 [Candidatus Saccharimonadales bacterium]|nr:50S ribosomal protein L13 [Candidatus Saccharimonadales bacterium]